MNQRISFVQAVRLVADTVTVSPGENVPTALANGRILAAPVVARRDCPPYDMSAMDGYALGILDAGASAFWLGSPHYAGALPTALLPGEARPIATGAAVPAGTQAIVMKERAILRDGSLVSGEPLAPGTNIRRRAEDARAGEVVMAAGSLIHPAAIGALCAYGVAQVTVRRRPRIALVTLGDELAAVEHGGEGGVIDANGPMIAAMLAQAGCAIVAMRRLPDDQSAIVAVFAGLLADGVDMIVSTGGASVGDRDLLRACVEDLGATVHFHGVHMRPGKPVLFATMPGGAVMFGLPGNPVAALVGARFFIMRAIRAMMGLGAEPPLTLLAQEAQDGPTRILKIAIRPDGDQPVTILPGQQSHILRPLLQADGWLVRGGGQAAAVYRLYDRLTG